MNLLSVLVSAAETGGPGSFSFDLNSIISGSTGAGLLALIIWAAKLILDRTVPSRSDARANVTIVLEGLSNMVKVLQEEKLADSKRLNDKQARIDLLESAADKDFETIGELRKEIIELRTRLAQKDRHIAVLVNELRKIGAQVTGLDYEEDTSSLEITLPPFQTRAPQEKTPKPEVPTSTGDISQ